MKILHVCANPKPTEESASKQLATTFFSTLVQRDPDVEIVNIDLYQDPPPFLSYEHYRACWNPVFIKGYQPTDPELEAAAYARRHAEIFKNSDLLVLTMPMWHFSMPAIMKAWIDQLMSPDLTFVMEPDGPKALHNVTRIILLVASGDVFKEDDPRDALTAGVRAAFGFLGITDIMVAWADGQNAQQHGDFSIRKELAMEAAQELAEEVSEQAQA